MWHDLPVQARKHACLRGNQLSCLLPEQAPSERSTPAATQAERVAELTAAAPVLQLEFGLGNWLAASNAAGQVQLWRPALDGTWNLLTSIDGTEAETLS